MIQHTVCFSLVHPHDSAAERGFLETAAATLAGIPGVSGFRIALQVSTQSDLEWQFAMDFDDQAAYDAYSAHPSHVAFVESRWVPEVARFTEFDFVPWGDER
ncbi:Dabb family protein [Frondihabitans australicus]|uniref:Stress responsive alpha/beta barrel protein n=1 Tax=Frondihabitans australicus TaxID=386892 RepID=A0A495IBS5_9MICO|nr:Dabb family protein [Frondihabitans australicus]RKR73453.1 stress responsive alpha/beta barrel protein [Frondihabitans australicus]